MEPTLVNMTPFTVTGIKTRTNNVNEQVPAQARISVLWGDFFSRNITEKVLGKVEQSPMYGVYTNYQSDYRGDFDVIAGVKTTQSAKGELTSVEIQGGNYLVFEGKGPLPQVVIRTWLNIWNYFSEPQSVTRLYTTDFEIYGKESVAVYIAVKPVY